MRMKIFGNPSVVRTAARYIPPHEFAEKNRDNEAALRRKSRAWKAMHVSSRGGTVYVGRGNFVTSANRLLFGQKTVPSSYQPVSYC